MKSTKMEFIVTDREGIEAGILVRSAYIVISIHDPYLPPPRVVQQAGLRGILQLAFDDIEPEPIDEDGITDGLVLMTRQQAEEIWRFVKAYKAAVGAVVVHCEAGMSRSPAVAAARCKGMGGDDRWFWREYQPNQYVYRLMLEAADGKPE